MRPDVAKVYPNVAKDDNCGWDAVIETSSYAPGNHELTVQAIDNNGSTNDIGVIPFVVGQQWTSTSQLVDTELLTGFVQWALMLAGFLGEAENAIGSHFFEASGLRGHELERRIDASADEIDAPLPRLYMMRTFSSPRMCNA